MMKASRVWVLVFLSLVAVIQTACRTGSPVTTPVPTAADVQTQEVPVEGGGSYTDVSADGLATLLENKDFPLINVHVPYEGEIPNTDLFIPYDEVEDNLEQLPPDKAAKLVLYCRSGGMSAIAARTLVALGYSNVWNLDGGMIAWKQAGYPLLDKGQ